MTGTIRGKMAVLSFWNDAWLPYVCSTDVSIQMTSKVLPVRTVGDGHWNKNTYQDAGFSLTLGGTLMYDLSNWTGFDFTDNWLGFLDVRFRLALTDENGNIKSFQGYIIVNDHTISFNAAGIVKSSLSLTGNGELQYFDGLIPCPSTITGIGVSGATGGSGVLTFTYTYTGSPYQVKYRLDGAGPYTYALLGVSIVISGLSMGNHSIEIIPVCQNGYEADNGASQAFIVTYGLTCSAVCTSVSTSGGSLSPIFTGSPTSWQYSIDGGPYIVVPISITSISIGGLGVGAHTVSVQPICSNGAIGTGIINQAFTVTSNPAQSTINYNWLSSASGNVLQIFVNGVLNVSQILTSSGSGSIVVATGATVKAVLAGNNNTGFTAELKVKDTTTSTTISDQFGAVPTTLTYIFTPSSGDTYSVTAIVNP